MRIYKVGSKSSQNIKKSEKFFGQSGKFPDSMESFWIIWKISKQSGNASGMFVCYNMDKINEVSHKQSWQKELFTCRRNNFSADRKVETF